VVVVVVAGGLCEPGECRNRLLQLEPGQTKVGSGCKQLYCHGVTVT
jgi:hypothetical protein